MRTQGQGGKCPGNGRGRQLIPVHMGQRKTWLATQPKGAHWFSVLLKTRVSVVEITEAGSNLIFHSSLLQVSPSAPFWLLLDANT